ncbi:MAG: rhomboid family intramembrane serine protease, partial [Bacteroidota bacterium]
YYRPSMFGGFSFFPPVIKGLLMTNVAVFLLTQFLGSMKLDGVSLQYFIYRYFALLPFGEGFLPWQLITYQFMHGGFWHLFFNMFFGLWMFGMEIEQMWGAKKFLGFYLMCGVVAGLVQLLLAPLFEPSSSEVIRMGPIPVVGASGAVYGVLVAFGMLFPDRYIFLYFLIPVKVKYFVMVLIAFGVLSVGDPTNVAHLAHLGGALAGYVYLLANMRRGPISGLFNKIRWWWSSLTVTDRSAPEEIKETKVFDIRDGREDDSDREQRRVDEILDKISRGGYQSLTEDEKKILFEASRKLN